ncbi:unnamed protein product [Didymodactylos carnosus]|nr:unnamed protein product [Didymodactylos carnosus]CAF3530367.1 unnamed protein product [Didymodactylos carnosus]
MDSYPLKLVELHDFLKTPSILKETLSFKNNEDKQVSKSRLPEKKRVRNENHSTKNVVLLNQKPIYKRELTLPENTILFIDESDRERIGIHTKTSHCFAKNVLITSAAALASLIPVLTNANDWLIMSKLIYSKRYCFGANRSRFIHGDVVMLLNVSDPFVRCELLKAFYSLYDTFNETKPAYIIIDFTQLLMKWFKENLTKTDQYHRHDLRWKIQPYKCFMTFGNGRQWRSNANPLATSMSKLFKKYNQPLKIMIDFNYLPTVVYSIQFNNLFAYAMNEEHEQTLKDMGNGLTLMSVQNLLSLDKKTTEAAVDEEFVGEYCVQPSALTQNIKPEIVQPSSVKSSSVKSSSVCDETESYIYETKKVIEPSPPAISLNSHPLCHQQQFILPSSYPSCYQPHRQYDLSFNSSDQGILEQILCNQLNKIKENHNNIMELMKKTSARCLTGTNMNNNQLNGHQNIGNRFSQELMVMSSSSQQHQTPIQSHFDPIKQTQMYKQLETNGI